MVYVFLVDGFEEMEAVAPIDLMRRAGISVATVGVGKKTALGAHGINVETDIELDNVSLDDAEMFVLPGGPGHTKLKTNEYISTLLLKADRREIPMAAICASPSVIGSLGLLQRKNGTCYPGFEAECVGMRYTGAKVEVDGRFITSRGAGTATEFALAIVEKLCGKEKADEIKSSIQA